MSLPHVLPSSVRRLAPAAALGGLYAMLAAFGLLLTRDPHGIAVLWPANAVVVGLLLRYPGLSGGIAITAVTLAGLATHLAFGDAFLTALALAAANAIEILAALAVMVRLAVRADRHDLPALGGILAGAGAGAVLGASAAALSLAPMLAQGSVRLWIDWAVADCASFLVLVPLILWTTKEGILRPFRGRVLIGAVEMATMLIALGAAILVERAVGAPIVMSLLGPPLIWLAVRHGLVPVALFGCLAGTVGLAAVGLGALPSMAATGDAAVDMVISQALLALTVLPAYGVALATADAERIRRDLAASEERLATALAASEDGLWDWDIATGELFLSPSWEAILGYEPGELAPDIAVLRDRTHPTDWPRVEAALRDHLTGAHDVFDVEQRLRHKDGRWVWVHNRGKVTARDETGRAVRAAGFVTDITARKILEQNLTLLASRDLFTGLSNRAALEGELGRLAAGAGARPFTLMLLDLDRFKAVNDTHGHAAGDKLLVDIARRLREATGRDAMRARLGGDEFAILLPVGTPREKAETLAARLVDQLCRPAVIDGMVLDIGASVGLAHHDGTPVDAHTLMARADAALYAAKRAGRGCWRVWHPDLGGRVSRAA